LVFASAINHISKNNDITTGLLLSAPFSINADTALNDSAVWGVWSETTVPVPAEVWLFGSGLIGLLSIRKTSK
jgi:hypothetical protein